jgi:hypothetical protein
MLINRFNLQLPTFGFCPNLAFDAILIFYLFLAIFLKIMDLKHYSNIHQRDMERVMDGKLNILSLNIWGLTGKLDEFEFFLKSFKSRIQIIAITETWLRDPEKLENKRKFLTSLHSYEAYHDVGSDRKGGGILLLIGKEFPSKLMGIHTSGDIQMIVVSLIKLKMNVCIS